MDRSGNNEGHLAKKRPPYTKTVETGAFIRTKYRSGNTRRQKTEILRKNQKKVILGHIGDFEAYIYPYDYPDTVFVGSFPISTKIENSNVNQLLAVYNRARWFLNGEAFTKPKTRKEANLRRQHIQRAYNCGLNEQRRKKQAPIY